jgi:hypothetical protein
VVGTSQPAGNGEGTDQPADEDEQADEAGEGEHEAEQASALLDQGTWPTPEAVPESPSAGDEPGGVWPRIETPSLAGASAFDLGVGLGPSVLVTTAEPGGLSGITDVVDQPPEGAVRTTETGPSGTDGGLLGDLGPEVLDPRGAWGLDIQVPDIQAPGPDGRLDLLG